MSPDLLAGAGWAARAAGKAAAGVPRLPGAVPRNFPAGQQVRRVASAMKRYKYQALVSLPPQDVAGLGALSPGSACRMVIRGRHHETGASRFFSALVTTSADTVPGDSHIVLVITVVGDDADDYLGAGEDFALWRGHDIGRGVATRRIFA